MNGLNNNKGQYFHIDVSYLLLLAQTDNNVYHQNKTPRNPAMSDAKWARFSPNWVNIELFKIRFMYIFISINQNVLKIYSEKTQFVPFGAKLVHFSPKSNIPAESIQPIPTASQTIIAGLPKWPYHRPYRHRKDF